MSGGLDQALATSLTRHRQFQVVTDPQIADAIFTDRLGESFEKKVLDLYPPPEVEEPIEKEVKKDEKKDDKDDKKPDKSSSDIMTLKTEPMVRIGGFGRSKGDVYLVDRTSKKVIWSLYKRPKNATPDEIDKTAEAIVKQLKHDLTAKDPTSQK